MGLLTHINGRVGWWWVLFWGDGGAFFVVVVHFFGVGMCVGDSFFVILQRNFVGTGFVPVGCKTGAEGRALLAWLVCETILAEKGNDSGRMADDSGRMKNDCARMDFEV